MSAAQRKGLLLAALQVVLVLSLGAKLLYDRATRPRVWVRAQYYDPDLPIRGRYLSESLLLPAEGFTLKQPLAPSQSDRYLNRRWVYFGLRSGQLVAEPQGGSAGSWAYLQMRNGQVLAQLEEPVLLFIPERAAVPQLHPEEEMWAEVTVPAEGPPRPIRLAIKRNGTLQPLVFK